MEILGSKQVSEWTGVPVGTLRYWRHANEGPASFTLGRRVVYRRDAVEQWIDDRERATLRGGSLDPDNTGERHFRIPDATGLPTHRLRQAYDTSTATEGQAIK